MSDSQSVAHIANHYLQVSIHGAERQGLGKDTLLGSAGIPTEWLNKPEQLIAEQQLTQLVKSVRRASRPRNGLANNHVTNTSTWLIGSIFST